MKCGQESEVYEPSLVNKRKNLKCIAMANPKDNIPSISAQQCSETTPHTEDTHCELVIGISQPPVRLRFHGLSHNQSVISFPKAGNTRQLLLQIQEDETRPQQRQPLLPPEPRPTCLPIPEIRKLSTPHTLPHDTDTTPHTEDLYCELVVIGCSQPPTVRPRVQPFHTQPDLRHKLNVISLLKAGGTQLLQRQEDGTRPQQKQPLLPPEPRPTCLPIPQPPTELHKPSTPPAVTHVSTPHTTEDHHCELVIAESSQPLPVRPRVQSFHIQHDWTHNLSELLTKRLNEVIADSNTKQLLQRQEDGTRPQQRRPLLPPEPRPTHLPIPQPPPPPPSSPTPSHDTSDQTCDDHGLTLSIITVSSGYGSLTRSVESRQSFMYYDDDDIKDDCDLTGSTREDWVTPHTSSH